MPIALVITDLDVGGAERALVSVATGLDRRRWLPSIVCLGSPGALVSSLEAARIPVECLGVSGRHPLDAVRKLAASFRRIRPSLVQSFLFHANVSAKLAACVAGRPWVVGGIRVAERRNRWHLGLERWTQRLSAGSVCVSEGVRRHAITTGGLDPDRLQVIPNGIDVASFDRRLQATSGSPALLPPRTILFVGRIEPQKGVETLLDAFAAVAHERPDWSLALVGDGPDRARLSDGIASNADLKSRVHWLGRRDDVPGLMRAADLFVLPSHWEGMPNALLEAMAAGKPAIATRVEGSEDLVVDEGAADQTGWLVEPGDSVGLARVILQATTHPEELPSLGRTARRRVEEHFALSRVIAGYEKVWSGLLGLDLATAPDLA